MNPFRQEAVDRIVQHTGLEAAEVDKAMSRPPKAELGDFAFPCFTLAKTLKKAPPLIANELVEKLGGESELIESVIATGPYVNLKMRRDKFAEYVLRGALSQGEEVGASDEGQGRVVLIDYCSPNIAKPFHVGHLRSTIIGGSLYRIFAKLGYRSVGINHLGDWGTQFGKQIVGLKHWGKPEDIESLSALNELYVKYHEEEAKQSDEKELTAEARDWFRKQEAGDEEALALWEKIRDTSLSYLGKIFDRLGVTFEHTLGESFYNDKMDAVLEKADAAGITSVSDGALVVDLNDVGIEVPALLRKADGATLYMTRDLAAATYRRDNFDFYKMLYVVGTAQSLHFKQLFHCLSKLGYDWSAECEHVNFGMVLGMATRKGNVVYLEHLLDEAKERALAAMQENSEKRGDVDNIDEVAEAVGLAAIIFADLSRQRSRDYEFNWDTAISFEGDTGPYLINAHARIAGIIRKCGIEVDTNADLSTLVEPEAHQLITLVSGYQDALRDSAANCEPSILANYVLELARGLHAGYAKLRVKGEQESVAKARLLLFSVVKTVLADGMKLLGIRPLERM